MVLEVHQVALGSVHVGAEFVVHLDHNVAGGEVAPGGGGLRARAGQGGDEFQV